MRCRCVVLPGDVRLESTQRWRRVDVWTVTVSSRAACEAVITRFHHPTPHVSLTVTALRRPVLKPEQTLADSVTLHILSNIIATDAVHHAWIKIIYNKQARFYFITVSKQVSQVSVH